MIPRICLLVLFVVGLARPLLAINVWFSSIPSPVQSGQGYYVEAAAATQWGGGCDIYVYKNGNWFTGNSGYDPFAGASTTDYGVQTVEYMAEAYDWSYSDYNYTYAWVTITVPNNAPTISWSSAPGSAPVNQWFNIEAHGSDPDGNLAQVNVWREWAPHAFGGGGDGYNAWSGNGSVSGTAGAVTFMAQAVDGNGAASGVIYHTIYITENNEITFNHTNWPATSYMGGAVNFYYNITNTGSKYWGANHYLTLRDWSLTNVHFPWLNGYGPGWSGNVDFSFTAPGSPGVYTYYVQALEHMVEWFGPYQTMTLEVVNRAPVSPTISSGGVTQINLGQSVTISGTLQDPDGNLAYHNLYYAAPGGSFTGILAGTPSGGGYSSLSAGYTPNAVGVWQFHTNGHDNYAWGPGATLSVTVVDGTVPTMPGSLSASGNTTGSSFTLNWAASTDNVGVTAYEVMRDATNLGTTAATSMAITSLAQGVTYAMKVRARDAAGNWSAWSSILNVTTPDVTAPSIPNSATFSVTANTTGSSFTLNWAASTDNIGVTAYEVMRDSTNLGPTATASMSVTGLAQATTYAMKVRARDAAGNWSAWSIVLNVTTPDVTAPIVPAGLWAGSITNTSFTLNWTSAADNVGVTAYEVMRGSTSLGAAAPNTRAISSLMPGTTYAMKVRARDAAGNWSAWSGVLNVTTTAIANVDSDNDGVSDLVEQQLGTNPNTGAQTDQNNSNQLKIHRPNP